MDKNMNIEKIRVVSLGTLVGFDVACALQMADVKTVEDKKSVVAKFIAFQADNFSVSELQAMEKRILSIPALVPSVAETIAAVHGKKQDNMLNFEHMLAVKAKSSQNTKV